MTTLGAQASIDLATRINDLETAVFGGPNPLGGGGSGQGAVNNLSGSTDAIPVKSGSNFVTTAGVDAMTLAQPVAGGPGVGQDGITISVFDTGGHAHTVTTAANGINGASHIATFNGTKGSLVSFRAFNGVWYVVDLVGVTLS